MNDWFDLHIITHHHSANDYNEINSLCKNVMHRKYPELEINILYYNNNKHMTKSKSNKNIHWVM